MSRPRTSLLSSLALVVLTAGCSASQPDQGASPDAADDPGLGTPDAAPGADAAEACPFAPGSQPQKKVVFVDQYPEQDLDIENEVIATIQAAVPGSKIRIGLFTWTRQPVAEVLAEAHERGVDVRVVLDNSNRVEDPPGSGEYRYRTAVKILKDRIGDDRILLCHETDPDGGSCIGTGINHNKLFLFSELCDGSKNVVMQSSANLTNPQLKAHNNTVVIRDDPELFAVYESYWTDLAAQQRDLSYYRSDYGSTGTKAYFYPRAASTSGKDPSTDTIYGILANNVECTAGSRIRVAMAFWTMARSYLVDILRAKKDQGCDVKIIVSKGAASDALKNHLRSSFPASDITIADGVHHKYLLVDSQYIGAPRRLVWTGSHNYTGPALRGNDETLLRIDDPAVFEAFQANWDGMWASLP